MGSIQNAVITGFLCRLCSKISRSVIHIYGDKGVKMQLARKINDYLPVNISPNDPLPKTICRVCVSKVKQHHELITRVKRNSENFELKIRRMVREGYVRPASSQQTQTDASGSPGMNSIACTPTASTSNSAGSSSGSGGSMEVDDGSPSNRRTRSTYLSGSAMELLTEAESIIQRQRELMRPIRILPREEVRRVRQMALENSPSIARVPIDVPSNPVIE